MFNQNKIQEMFKQIEEVELTVEEFGKEVEKQWTELTGETIRGVISFKSFELETIVFGRYDEYYNQEPQYIPWRFVTDNANFIKEYKLKQKPKETETKTQQKQGETNV